MLIRVIEKSERKECLKIIISNLLEVNIKDYSFEVIQSLVKSYSKYYLKIPNIMTLLAEENGKILGTASMTENGQIKDVFVDIENHSKGIGRNLMQHLEEIAKNKNLEGLFLFSAKTSIDFYLKQGYDEIKRINFGKQGIQIRMEKKL